MNEFGPKKPDIKAIILAGNRDFGRCRLSNHLPPALWPAMGKAVLVRLLEHLSAQNIKHVVICSNCNISLLKQSICGVDSIKVDFLEEQLPLGSAGCIRDASDGDRNSLLLVCSGTIVSPPTVGQLLELHQNAESDMTVMFKQSGKPAEIYICEPAILDYIPEQGYCDIKESLIPELVRAGKTVKAAVLDQPVHNFRDRESYLEAIGNLLERKENISNSKNIYISGDANIDRDARMFGPVIVMPGATVAAKAVIFGPTIIGRDVSVADETLIENSVLWAGSNIGRNCHIKNCVTNYNATVKNNSVLENMAVTTTEKTNQLNSFVGSLIIKMKEKLPRLTVHEELKVRILWTFGISVLAAVFVWSFAPQLKELWSIWQESDEYSSGLLVPFLAVYVLWVMRTKISNVTVKPSMWGVFALLATAGFRYFGLFFMYSSAERLSIVLSIASVVLLVFGWRMLWKLSPILLFLLLMLPLPRSVHTAITLPLQNLATASAVFLMEMMGYAVIREGNIIHINGTSVAVAEACNGLRMVMSFFVITALVVLLMRRKLWEKLAVLFSSLPIALLCNTIRLTITAIAFTVLAGKNWEEIFHDFGGYAMMPMAVMIVVFELWFLNKLTVTTQETGTK